MRIIQISDCHLLDDKTAVLHGYNTYDSLQKVLKLLKGQHYDALILTGDLSQDGSCNSYQHLADLLKFNCKPVYLVAGNHDHPGNMREVLRKNNIYYTHSVEFPYWQILFLSSRIEGEVAGEIQQDDLLWLKHWLIKTQKPTLIALHHPPVDVNSHWMDASKLKNGHQFLEILQPFAHVKAIVCGHVHQSFDGVVQGLRILSCPSTCAQFKPQQANFSLDTLSPGYRWFELGDSGNFKSDIIRLNRT